MSDSSFSCFVFTCNNYLVEHVELLKTLAENEYFSYVIWGYEVGKKGTPHLQGYAELSKRKRFNQLKRKLGNQFSFRRRKGKQRQAIKYCKKDGDFVELGQKRVQGERKDLPAVAEQALDENMRSVVLSGRNLQQIRYAERALYYLEPERRHKPKVFWFWGESGVGKSRKAFEIAEKYDYYWKQDGSKWFDGYDAHECLVLDDVSYDWFADEGGVTRRLLAILDRYPCRLQVKGGSRQLRAKVIVITSISEPEFFDTINNELLRRLTTVENVHEVEG